MATADIQEADEEIVDHSKPPFLRRVRIRGYKSIAFCDVTLEPLTVLVGRNGAGKSNFLDALAFLRDAMETNVTEAIKRHGGWSSIMSRGSQTQFLEFDVEFGFNAPVEALLPRPNVTRHYGVTINGLQPVRTGRDLVAKYLLTISGGEMVAPVVAAEWLELEGEIGENVRGFKVDRSNSETKSESTLSLAYFEENPNRVADIGREILHRADQCVLGNIGVPSAISLADAIRKMEFQNVHPNAIRHLQKPSNGVLLQKQGDNLASIIRSLKGIDPDSLNRAKQYVCHIVEEVADFWQQSYGEYETVRFRMRTPAGAKPLEFDAASMSDGTLRVLANIMAVFQNVPPNGRPSVVGIEEPEAALHPRAMNALVDALDEATLWTQVLLTTHSPELLDNPTIKPKNLRVVQMIDGQTVIGPVDEASIEIVQRNLNTLGGLERDNLLEPDLDDRDRQQRLQAMKGDSPT